MADAVVATGKPAVADAVVATGKAAVAVLSVASEASWTLVTWTTEKLSPVVEAGYSAACDVAADTLGSAMGVVAETAGYYRQRLVFRAQRALMPSSDKARLPAHWTGDVEPTKHFRFVRETGSWVQPVFQKMLQPGNVIGTGVDQAYKYPQRYDRFDLAAVWRIEHPGLWLKYDQERRDLTRRINAVGDGVTIPKVRIDHAPFREASAQLSAHLQDDLDAFVGEVRLLHGTKPERLLDILGGGFDQRFARPGLFGRGTYFAEDAGKVDQYVTPDRDYRDHPEVYQLHDLLYPTKDDHPQDVFYLFVCRVQLGISARTQDGKGQLGTGASLWSPGAEERELAPIPGARERELFHSLVAEKGGKVVRYREFISFHGEVRAYPEYLVAYRRHARLPPME